MFSYSNMQGPMNYNILALKLLMFFFWPFGAFIYSLKAAASKSSYVIFFMFGVLFCWHMNPTGVSRYDDIVGIMERVVLSNFTYEQILQQVIDTFTFNENAPKELYENILIFISKLFSDNPHLYFAIASVPWLFFELKSVNKIMSDKKFTNSFLSLLALALFILPRDIITMQNPRFTTACWLVVYATIKYYKDTTYNLKYIFLILLSPLIHSAFWAYVGLFFIGMIARRFPKLMFILLYVSVPFSYLSYDLLKGINLEVIPLPHSLSKWITGYLSEDSFDKFVANEGASGFWWVKETFNTFITTSYLLIPYYLRKYKDTIKSYNLFTYFLYFYTVVNFIQFVPVLGARFMWIVRILAIYIWFKEIFPKHNNVLYLILFSYSFYIFKRYFYEGALSVAVPLDIFYQSTPYLIMDYLI